MRDAEAKLWLVDYRETVEHLCARLLRHLSDEERAQHSIADHNPTCPSEAARVSSGE